MAYFPMFVNLEKRNVLIVGGGMVALRKVQKILPFGTKVTVIAPEIVDKISEMDGLIIKKRQFEESDLDSELAMVIAATDDVGVNKKIAMLCRERNIPVNVVDDAQECSFIFPALVSQGNFSAGISTGGASPTAAIYYKERMQELVPENIDEILDWLEIKRQALKRMIPEQAKRAGIFRKLFDACLEKERPLTEEEMEQYIEGKNMGSVALVGAGCGKADLITVRGLRLLQQCEAVVYDDLIDQELLEAVPETALRIYMGKRLGAHSAPQEEINRKLIELAKKGLKVVRLKGGDPYLFGRGGEEMLALIEEGVPCQEVPGIPSAIGIAAEAGIPVTHRGASRGLHIITAHTSDTEDKLPADFEHYANLSGTLVFLMGLKQLPKIAKRLIQAGKSADTPAAVLSGGNSPNPARVRAPLSQIAQAVEEANVKSPAIIMIGEVTSLDFTQQEKVTEQLLRGITVGITGTEEIAKKQEEALKAYGAKSVWVSRSMVRELPFAFDVHALENKLKSGKNVWLVFTSANGVKIFFRQMEAQGVRLTELTQMQNLKFAVIGSATGKILEQYGCTVHLCPKTFTSEGLANELVSKASKEDEIILLRSVIGSVVLPEILENAGFCVSDIATYELETIKMPERELPKLDYLTFSSASGVKLYWEQYHNLPKETKAVCIGPVTAKALEAHIDEFLSAKEITVDGMVQAILEDRQY